MTSGTSFVKKKAALAAIKIVKKLPDTAEDFVEKVEVLMEDRHHGVLLSTLSLVEILIVHKPEYKNKFKKYFTPMIRVLKGLVSSYSAEFDISGVSDPFL
jgi:AP-1 complex subunit gamma-1